MTAGKNAGHNSDEMRRCAETINRENIIQTPEIMEALSPEATRLMLNELRAHHHELEMQNEELRRTQEALRHSAGIQDVLREISEAAVLAVTLDELYVKVHRAIGRVLPAKNFYISFLDNTGSQFRTPYCVDETCTIPTRRPVGKGMTDYVIRQRRAVYVTPTELARLRESGEVIVSLVNYIKWAGAPLIDATGKAFGVIALFSIVEEEQPLQPEDVEVLSIIAAQVSQAIERKRVEEALVAERNLLKTLIDEMPDRIFVKDRQSRFILNNIAHINVLGAQSQSEVLGKTGHDFRPAAYADRHLADDLIVMENDKPLYDYEEPTILPSGETGTLLISKIPLHNVAGEVIGLIGISRDITERRRAEEALRESEATYFALVQNATAGIVLRDESGLITYANDTFAQMMQADDPSELLGRPYQECVHPEDRAESLRRIAENLSGTASPLRERRLVGLQGKTIFVESTGVPIARGGRPFAMGVFHDVTERRRLEEELKYQATTDGLTGIFNRRYFLARADEELHCIHRYGGTCSLLMVDIDHFKLVNDNFGHAVGDTVLQWVTNLCREAIRSTDLPGRVGGEEFAILLPETGISEAKQIAERLRQSIQDTAFSTKEGIQIPLSVSIGVAEHQPDHESLSDLMIRSDKALYRAKNEGRNKVVEAE